MTVRILTVDIETSPVLASVWKLFDENISLNQIERDWFILSFAAKWLDSDEVIYMDQRNAKNIEDDSKLLKKVWELLNECDVLITQNGKQFDTKKLNARFIINGFQPPSGYRQIDTCQLARKHFGFTSNKLEYMTEKLNKKYKKLKHEKFPGFELWKECLKGNKEAFKEMEKYNKFDVLSTEELYKKLIPWDNSINFDVYTDQEQITCKCGSTSFLKRGFHYTESGKFQRYRCNKCGAETRDSKNLFSKEKRASLRRKV